MTLLFDDESKLSFACTPKSRLKGLIGRRDFEGTLLLAPCGDVHTLGMHMPIDIAFVDSSGRVLKSIRNVGPGHRVCCRAASATLERKASPKQPWPQAGSRLVMGFDPLCK